MHPSSGDIRDHPEGRHGKPDHYLRRLQVWPRNPHIDFPL